MAIVSIHTPRLNDAIGIAIFTRTAYMIRNAVTSFLAAFAHVFSDFGQGLIPCDALPFPFTTLANALERIEDSFRVVCLVVRGGAFGAITSPTTRMHRIAFKFLDFKRGFVHIS